MWIDVKGYEGLYEVSDSGAIRSKTRTIVDSKCSRVFVGKILKTNINTCGYYYVTLSKNGIRKKIVVHRLVAEAFVLNACELPQVNHKDGNKLNNNASNLEWCTNAENTLHAYRKRLNVRGQRLIDYKGKTKNLSEWAKEFGIPIQTLWNRLDRGLSIETALGVIK